MCGIVGLHLKDPGLQPQLGALVVPMLEALTSRGPDSAGVAFYADDLPAESQRWSVRSHDGPRDWQDLASALARHTGRPVTADDHDVIGLLVSDAPSDAMSAALAELAPELVVVGRGRAMTLWKDIGSPADICGRYGLATAHGYQAVGHTRMATESAVTTEHSHPFSPAADLTLVHNGSFSNHAAIRRRLADDGIACETDNDSEVAARFIAQRLDRGDDLEESLMRVLKEFDGFFTLLVATRTQFAVVRDAFACKPLVVADAAQYVAVASEYQALADLPGVESARVFEPMPEEVHSWTR
jgi:methylamine---glutamate N-methyltransferase subunit A